MHGTGVPLVTPFTEDGDIDETSIPKLASWVIEQGVDFLVPCGSTGESELLTLAERAFVTELVVDAVPDEVPVVAGTGHPGLEETLLQTDRAADAGADAALVITPHYFTHDQETLEAYFRDVAAASPLPVYLYNMPKLTGMELAPDVIGRLATHENIHGMKDSSGDLEALQRYQTATNDHDFDLLVGNGGIYAAGLDIGAEGGILAMANVVPERASEIYRFHQASKHAAAREVNQRVVELNHALTKRHGVPGTKAAMRSRDVPAGVARKPFRPVDEPTELELEDLVADALP